MKYHITEDGPKVCRAVKRACPVGGEHFDNAKDAETVYAAVMNSFSTFTPMTLSPATEAVVNKLKDAGIKPLLVGGCVRDHILGKESKDVDLELYGARPDGHSLSFQDVTSLFPRNEGFTVDEAGASFSVLKVRVGKEDFDLALPRTEASTGEHHRDYDVQHDSTMSFEEAASRRDFTINSMGYNPSTKELVDPYGGAKDLKAGVLRHVGPAFSDDPLRCLRAVNFASRFNLQVAPETLKLCRELAPSYKTLPRERVEEEFTKALEKGKHLQRGLEVLHDIGWSKEMPPFKNVSKEEFSSMGKKLDATPVKLRRAVLARSMEQNNHPDPTKLLTSTTKEQGKVEKVKALMEASKKGKWGDIVAAHRQVKKTSPEVSNTDLAKALKVTGDDASIFKKLPETPVLPVVTGQKLIERGFKPGPAMGALIGRAQAIQDEESIYDFDKLLARSVNE